MISFFKKHYVNINFTLGLILCFITLLIDKPIVLILLKIYLLVEFGVLLLTLYEIVFQKHCANPIGSLAKTGIIMFFSFYFLLNMNYGIHISSKLALVVSAVFCIVTYFSRDKDEQE